MNEIIFHKKNNEIECVYYKDWNKRYPPHTHAKHIILGIVEHGEVCVICNEVTGVYKSGEQFCILPNVLHEIKPIDDKLFSMMLICIQSEVRCNDKFMGDLWERIIVNPENRFMVEDMARYAKVSPFYLIRQFKKAFGLTPHQFQIQCRVMKAQKLLEEGKNMTEVTYSTGFCDESHFDRCFKRIVQLTPSEYLQSIVNDN